MTTTTLRRVAFLRMTLLRVLLLLLLLQSPGRIHSWILPTTTTTRKSGYHEKAAAALYRSRSRIVAIRHPLSTPSSASLSSAAGSSSHSFTAEHQQQLQPTVYQRPALYDVAFGYRDYQQEVEFLMQASNEYGGISSCRHVLELGAGPGRHAITALADGIIESATCVDLSDEMRQYSQDLARAELSTDKYESSFRYIVDDMKTLKTLSNNIYYDSVWILLGTLQHMISHDDIISCFQSIYRILQPGGIIIIELPHPKELFQMGQCTRNIWNVPLDEEKETNDDDEEITIQEEDNDDDDDDDDDDEEILKEGKKYLQIMWGDDDDDFDPIQQVLQLSISMKYVGGQKETLSIEQEQEEIEREVVPLKFYTIPEMALISRLCGYEFMTPQYGALDIDSDIHDEETSYRFIGIMRKPLLS